MTRRSYRGRRNEYDVTTGDRRAHGRRRSPAEANVYDDWASTPPKRRQCVEASPGLAIAARMASSRSKWCSTTTRDAATSTSISTITTSRLSAATSALLAWLGRVDRQGNEVGYKYCGLRGNPGGSRGAISAWGPPRTWEGDRRKGVLRLRTVAWDTRSSKTQIFDDKVSRIKGVHLDEHDDPVVRIHLVYGAWMRKQRR